MSGVLDSSGDPLRYTPHDFRRMFITDAILNGLPPHIAQVIAGHRNINTTMGYKNPRELHQMHDPNASFRWLAACARPRIGAVVGARGVSRIALTSRLMQDTFIGCRKGVVVGRAVLAGAASAELVGGVRQLRPEEAMVEAMLRGWRAQQTARGLRASTIDPRERLVRRFIVFTNEFPWQWGPARVDEWTLSLTSEHHLGPATIRGYQTELRLFSEYITDARYGWASACEEAFGQFPVPICHEWNTIAHLNDYEGSPEARPFTRAELQRFLDYADDQVERAARAKRKGALAAYRDATVFKVVYGWGLRRTETAKLDLVDWGRNPAAPEFGRFGMLHVRYGKAVRGQPARRRNVASVMGWAVDAVTDYVQNVRPRFDAVDHPALWVTERGGRVKPAEINARFVAYRDALGLPRQLTPHSLRHSYVTHLTEDGADRRFIQEQVGHRCDTSTAIYTHVSGDFMNTALRKALTAAFEPGTQVGEETR